MTTRKAPYSHTDGSNCWTKDCSRGHRKNLNQVPFEEKILMAIKELKAGFPEWKPNLTWMTDEDADRFFSDNGINKTIAELATFRHTVKTGSYINDLFKLRTWHETTYNPKKILPVVNPGKEGDHFFTKPTGGMWLATVRKSTDYSWDADFADESGEVDSWQELWADPAHFANQHVTSLKFKPSARVLMIDDILDYRAILAQYSFSPEFDVSDWDEDALRIIGSSSGLINKEGKGRRTLDYEKIAQEFDGIMFTNEGIWTSGRGHYGKEGEELLGNDTSLYLVDIESCLVFNGNALEII